MIATQAEGRVYGCKPVLRTRDAGTACRPKPVRRVLVCQADRRNRIGTAGSGQSAIARPAKEDIGPESARTTVALSSTTRHEREGFQFESPITGKALIISECDPIQKTGMKHARWTDCDI
jgi:hypothetical protein